MHKLLSRFGLVFLIAILAMAGCDDDDSPTAPIVDPVEPPTVTITFAGSIAQGTTGCHDFNVPAVGAVQLSITELQPLETLTVGMGAGFVDDTVETGCALFATDRSVKLNDVLQTTVGAPDNFCVCVFDVGNIFPDQTVTYTVSVTHPTL